MKHRPQFCKRDAFIINVSHIHKTCVYRNLHLKYSEILASLPLKLGKRQKCYASPFLLNIVLEAIARAITEEKRNKRHNVAEARSNISPLANFTIIHV